MTKNKASLNVFIKGIMESHKFTSLILRIYCTIQNFMTEKKKTSKSKRLEV